MTDIQTIVYVSTATHLLSMAELDALLADARVFNHAHDVTGVLLYHEGNFMQCMEGPPKGVSKVYERICRSSQHKDIIELLNQPTEERSFPDWHMGLTQATASELLNLSTAQWRIVDALAPETRSASSPGLALLRVFWRNACR
jgi:hypothetical protein